MCDELAHEQVQLKPGAPPVYSARVLLPSARERSSATVFRTGGISVQSLARSLSLSLTTSHGRKQIRKEEPCGRAKLGRAAPQPAMQAPPVTKPVPARRVRESQLQPPRAAAAPAGTSPDRSTAARGPGTFHSTRVFPADHLAPGVRIEALANAASIRVCCCILKTRRLAWGVRSWGYKPTCR